MNLFSNNW